MDYKHERILEIKLTTDAIKSLSNWIVDDQKLFQLNCFSVLQAYYREGVALQCLGKHADALAAFSQGLAQDPKSLQLLAGLVEAAMKSPLKGESWYKNIWANFSGCVSGSKMRLRNIICLHCDVYNPINEADDLSSIDIQHNITGTLEPTYHQLQTMKLDKSPFVIISVIGQELLAQTNYKSAVQVLESALKIGTCSLKLRGSVFSALSSAYWALNSLDKVRNSFGKYLQSNSLERL